MSQVSNEARFVRGTRVVRCDYNYLGAHSAIATKVKQTPTIRTPVYHWRIEVILKGDNKLKLVRLDKNFGWFSGNLMTVLKFTKEAAFKYIESHLSCYACEHSQLLLRYWILLNFLNEIHLHVLLDGVLTKPEVIFHDKTNGQRCENRSFHTWNKWTKRFHPLMISV